MTTNCRLYFDTTAMFDYHAVAIEFTTSTGKVRRVGARYMPNDIDGRNRAVLGLLEILDTESHND